jgi:hypothetical protein
VGKLPEEVHALLRGIADECYGGNFSRFLGDAGMFYAGVLRGQQLQCLDRPVGRNPYKKLTP